MLRRPEDQPAPAAADVEEALARLEPQLAADVVELLRLRDVERVVLAAEVRARVHHALVEPQPVERVADVVVVRDVRAVGAPLVQPRAPRARKRRLAVLHVADHALGDVEDAPRAAREVDVAAHVGLREAPERGPRERDQAPQRPRGHLDLRGFGETHAAAVGEHHLDRNAGGAVAGLDQLRQ